MAMKYYSAIKKEIIPFATTRMKLSNMLSKISHTEKSRYYMMSLECGI